METEWGELKGWRDKPTITFEAFSAPRVADRTGRREVSKHMYDLQHYQPTRHKWRFQGILSSISSVTQLCPTHCNPMDCSMPCLPVHHQCRVYSNSCSLSWWGHPTISSSVIPFSPCLQSFPASGNESVLRIRRPKYWSFSFSISPSNEYSALIYLNTLMLFEYMLTSYSFPH